jgi:hypothetical protein
MAVPVKPRSIDPVILATSFLYTPPALGASTTVDVTITYNFVTGALVASTGTLAAAPGFIAEQAFSRLRANYNVNLWTTSTGTNVGLAFSNACCVIAGQLNFRLSNSSAAPITPAQLTMMMSQA